MRPRPAEKRLAHACSEVTSTASKMAASLQLASRKRSTSGFSISPGLGVSLPGKAEQFHVRIFPYSSKTGFQERSGLNRSILINSLRVAGPKSFS